MADPQASTLASLPSVDRLLRSHAAAPLIALHGRSAVTQAIRDTLAELRAARQGAASESAVLSQVSARLDAAAQPSLRPVFNLTGTVLHTNLGRASLPQEAIDAMVEVARGPSNLEFDLAAGRRGERDDHVGKLLCSLTGAQAATVVNNNAAAVLLVLNTLARGKEVPVSRGELIEIGGSFRLPDIMARADCRLREVGTTNRTHLADFADAIGPKTGAVLKAHASNYSIEGFTAAVPEAELAQLCRDRGVPFVVDLGSGALVDLRRYGLPHEPTVAEALERGTDLVTFSGDKLLGGPQAGLIVGRADLVQRIRKNPMKRALRVDKMTLAALAALLRIYADPDRVAERIPTLRLLARPLADIRRQAKSLQPLVQSRVEESVDIVDCESQVGSGAAPAQRLASAGLAIRPGTARLAAAFRALPIPVIGRVQDGAFILDLRCLEDEAAFSAQLEKL
ncbi:MAG TPA: L-seryl-tRNA(Sec) selenium transferase [Burkholderiales bacterium]|jgi:L-seryl-tRNA(Ser) seleniumtransferase